MLAQRFDKNSFFDPLAVHRDELKGLHVNTHIPQVIAAARLYELTGDKHYWISPTISGTKSPANAAYCTGGTSNFELWRMDPGVLSTRLSTETSEDCCAYNMMKLTRHLFGWSPQPHYMDYYERLVFNHRMGRSILRLEPRFIFCRLVAATPRFSRSLSIRSGVAMVPAPRSSRS